MTTHPFDRQEALGRLAQGRFDLLVIGGGVTGAGVALDASARGLSTALVERDDFASGTSSRSSKLVHGGIRYLQQREFGLVYESLAERQRLLRNAPHLVTPLEFLIPLFGRGGVVDSTVARAYSSALWIYDLTGGLRIGKRHRRIGAQEALALMPTLRTDRLVAGFIYYDAQTDDARLTLAMARTAVCRFGAVAANYAGVTELSKAGGRLEGAMVRVADPATGAASQIEVRARAVVNATGVWADEVRALDEPGRPASIRPAKGIHLTVSRDKLPCRVATVLPVPGDRRSIFVVPWGEEVYIGTTDTDYEGPLEDPRCTREDEDYLLGAVNAAVNSPLSHEDVTGAWAGLRPLATGGGGHLSERTQDLSRRHLVSTSPAGMVSVTGGKLTTTRRMAADTVDAVVRQLGKGMRRSPTKRMRLLGAEGTAALRRPGSPGRMGADPALLEHLVSRYGGEAPEVLALAASEPSLGARVVEGMPYLGAEVLFGARREMALTLEDLLSRRTRALVRDRDSALRAAPAVAALVAGELGWGEAEVASQVASLGEGSASNAVQEGAAAPEAGT